MRDIGLNINCNRFISGRWYIGVTTFINDSVTLFPVISLKEKDRLASH